MAVTRCVKRFSDASSARLLKDIAGHFNDDTGINDAAD
jgi:hypothetical protein